MLRRCWIPKLQESGREAPSPLIYRHPQLPDVLVVPSAPYLEPTGERNDAEMKHVIVDRLCGEAVLRGSDIFVKGVECVHVCVPLLCHRFM